MLSKLIARFKADEPVAQNTDEIAAADAISTPEKVAALLARLDADIAAEPHFGSRYRLLRSQHDQATLAALRHQIEAERQRVAAVVKRDKAQAEKTLADANEQHTAAVARLGAVQAKHQAAADRLEPLEAELKKTKQQAGERAAEAQNAFDAAIATGDEVAETAAAEKLYQAQEELKRGGTLAGPLGLRIGALRRELEAVAAAVDAAAGSVDEAARACLRAKAELSFVEYDRQAQALLDAYLAQRAAEAACVGDPEARSINRRAVGNFEVQICSPERIVNGLRMDAYNRRILPVYIIASLLDAVTKTPNLKVLAARVEDLQPDEVDESASGRAHVIGPDGEVSEAPEYGQAPQQFA